MVKVTVTPVKGTVVQIEHETEGERTTNDYSAPAPVVFTLDSGDSITISEDVQPQPPTRTGIKIETGENGEDAAVVEFVNVKTGTIMNQWIVRPGSTEEPAMMPNLMAAMKISKAV